MSDTDAMMTSGGKLTKYGHFIRYAAAKADAMMQSKFSYAQRMARAPARRAERIWA